ncbi:MAG: sugar phosphate nucleotidyltransferase [Cytophagales bacterium]|nr:sugar phosphate nucleotidyltransferase [Cytophagales bacterium]
MKIHHALIMAAGRGQRMMPLTDEIPKAMAIHEGSTLIANGIERLKASVDYIHITVGYKGAMLAKHVIEHRVSSVFNTDGKGNAWWIFNTVMRNLNEPVLVLTCDNIVELDSDLLIRDYHAKNDPVCMVVPVKPVEGLAGDFIFQTAGVVEEINRNKPSGIYCSGIQLINPQKINQLMDPVEDFNQVWGNLINLKQLYCSGIYPKRWFTVDTLEQLNHLNRRSSG